jgi:septal ring factor EnvC (AmiA/AmiB activator)
MTLTLILFHALSTYSPAHAEVVLDEIKANLEDVQKKVEQAKKQIVDLESNDQKLKKNIQQLETALNKKLEEQKLAKETHNDYTQKLASTGSAKKEFDRSC